MKCDRMGIRMEERMRAVLHSMNMRKDRTGQVWHVYSCVWCVAILISSLPRFLASLRPCVSCVPRH